MRTKWSFYYENYGSRFIWLTDDNFGLAQRANDLCNEIIQRGFADDVMWFMQARCDDVIQHRNLLPKMLKSGLTWILLGIESNNQSTLKTFNKKIELDDAKQAVTLLKDNSIFAQGIFILGEREHSVESIAGLRTFVNDIDPDLAIFAVLTPFPGTEIFEKARLTGWIEDWNWTHYDMVHAIISTETLSRVEVQEELYTSYQDFFGSWKRKTRGLFPTNEIKRRVYRYMATQDIIKQLRSLF